MAVRPEPSLKKSSPWPLAALIGANLVPLAGVLVLGWDIRFLIFSYWFENLVIGGYTILRMVTAQCHLMTRSPLAFAGYVALCCIAVTFFLFHYGGFCGAHGMFLLAIFYHDADPGLLNSIMNEAFQWPLPFVFVGMVVQISKALFALHPSGLLAMILCLVVCHGVLFVTMYLGRGEFREASASTEMTRPYKRIVLLHLVIMAAAFPVLLLHSPLPLLLALIAGKTCMDWKLHLKEQARPGVKA